MRAWIQDLLGQMKSKEQLQSVLHDLCEPHGRIVTADILCDQAEPRQVKCTVRMSGQPAAMSVADWLGTKAPGGDIVLLEYPAPRDFRS